MFNRLLLGPALYALLACVLLFSGCEKDDNIEPAEDKLVAEYSAEAALEWNKLFLEIERYADGYRPGPAPRALAHLGLAAYEACLPGMPDYQSHQQRLGINLPDVETGKIYHWPTVVHAVYTEMIPEFFTAPHASVAPRIAELVSELNEKYRREAGDEVFERSRAYGTNVAVAVWNWSKTDPYGHEAYRDPFGNFMTGETYNWEEHYNGPGDWEPTYPGPGKGMGPFFGKVRTFAINEAEKLARPPLPYSESSTSPLYAQALQVYAMSLPELSDENNWVAEFWSDDLVGVTFSPGPRWIAIGNQIIEREGSNLETALEAYAKTGMAINDAAVACWHSKYVYNVERPETYIKRLVDANWEPALYHPVTGEDGLTPSFPAYPSGHSTMGGAGAEALASVFGYNYAMTDRCHEGRTDFLGMPRSFGSLYEMAVENAYSRVPLGVHFWMDCEEGVRHGTEIGRKVNDLDWKK